MKQSIILILFVFCYSTLTSQTTSFETDIRFCDNTKLNSVSETSDGDFIVVGSRSDAFDWGSSKSDLIILKITNIGEYLSSPILYHDTSMSYYGIKIIRTYDNNHVILIKLVESHDCKERVLLIKINKNMTVEWRKYFPDYDFSPWSISEIDKNLKIEGTPKEDCLATFRNRYILTDSLGNEILNNFSFPDPKDNSTLLGSYEIDGTFRVEFKCDYIKNKLILESIIPNRDTIWKHEFKGASLYSSIAPTDSNGFVILTKDVRYSQSGIRFINVSGFGKILIDTSYYNEFSHPIPGKILRTPDNNYVFYSSITTKTSTSNDIDLMLVKITQKGEILWENIVGKDYIADYGIELTALNDGYMLLSDVVGETEYGDNYPVFYRFDNEGFVSQLFKNYYNFNGDSCTINSTSAIVNNGISVFPNPAEDLLFIKIPWNTNTNYEIINLEGKLKLKGTISNNQKVDISSLKRGIYIVRIFDNQHYELLKFLKL
jgi:hypothetical protein